MFAKRPANLAVATGPSSRDAGIGITGLIGGLARNPALGAGGAGLFFLLAAATVILVAGDPRAGAPSVRIALLQPGAAPPPGWREALAPDQDGPPPVNQDPLQLLPNAPDAGPIQGQATISFPGVANPGGDQTNGSDALPPAPIAGMTEPGPGGALLPIIGSGGRMPSDAYARPFHPNGKPKVALVIGGLGLNSQATRAAIEQLPADVTLSFVPYADGLQGWIDLARASGHEVLLEAPMEPNSYPQDDPGPYTLMAGSKPADIDQRLQWLLSRATGYFGLTNYLGSKFVTSDSAMAAFLGDLKQRGLGFIDDGSAARRGGGLPRASADRVVDDELAGDAIDKQLLALETTATQNGQALGSGFAYPITLAQVKAWAAGLNQRGYQLAPASALMTNR